MLTRRTSGILLHLTSLPSPLGVGDLGPAAYRFVDALHAARQGVWQVLPVGPTSPSGRHSPYESLSAFAGSPLLVSPELLCDRGLLTADELSGAPSFTDGRVDFENLVPARRGLLERAYERFRAGGSEAFETFRARHAAWLDDFALFAAVRSRRPGEGWWEWPTPLRDRRPEALEEVRLDLADEIAFEEFVQFVFFDQWMGLKRYANARGVQIVGDLPYYVGYDCADVWTHPRLFKLDDDRRRRFLSGVPPDYFSATGQLWGSPVYDWPRHAESNYAWWIARALHNFDLFDMVRIDHFRGFSACWEVPADEETAASGDWVEGPGQAIFDALLRFRSSLPIIGEDLGTITPEVRELLARYRFPGMKVLQFAFDGDTASNPYAPHNHVAHAVVYTGTHDNNTVRGWYEQELDKPRRRALHDYLGRPVDKEEIHWELIRMAMMSVCRLAVVPMQDVLGLGQEARMNRPAVTEGNWTWRLTRDQMEGRHLDQLSRLGEIFGRV